MKLFELMLTAVIITGGIVAGVVGLLLPKISTGLELGMLTSLFLATVIYGVSEIGLVGKISVSTMFVASMVAAVLGTQRFESICAVFRTALATGLLLALSVDALLGGGLLVLVSHVLRISSPNRSILCLEDCYVGQLLGLWFFVSCVYVFLQAYFNGYLAGLRRGTYSYMPVEPSTSGADLKSQSIPQQRTFSYPDTLEYNFFDPDNLPDVLTPFSEAVFTTVQTLAKLYGFQVDSSRNQAEHLLMMLTNETADDDTALTAPCIRLHTKLFSNYQKWCDRMGTPPLFANRLPGKKHVAYIEDMLVFLLIWGEGANLRHLPECLCFIYHKTMADHVIRSGTPRTGWKYPGFFLDMVVTPIYEVVAADLKKGGDHDGKKTYDDFNEFFWSPICMKYCLFYESEEESGRYTGTSSESSIHVSKGMQLAAKTYIEKRSWLHPLLSMHRVFEWHIITFSLLASWAFAEHLQWSYSFTLQVASFVFWEITLMSILWTVLEVWTLFPNAVMSTSSIVGFLLRLVAGYLVLCYQSVYYHWSFRPDVASSLAPAHTSSAHIAPGDETNYYWWWQFIWLSMGALCIYITESFLCWTPSVVSSLLTFNNDALQALLNICYPISQLFVGKKVHVPSNEVLMYILYWLSLISFKLWFGYRYIVHPVTVPSLELYDDYMNFQRISFYKTGVLMFVWWFPHFLVYLIDLSIWYSMWSSFSGGFTALIDRQGAVRDPTSFRLHFMRAPLAFWEKIMPRSTKGRQIDLYQRKISTASLSDMEIQCMTEKVPERRPASSIGESSPGRGKNRSIAVNAKKQAARARSSADLQLFEFATATGRGHDRFSLEGDGDLSPLENGAVNGDDVALGDVSAVISEFMDVRSVRWIAFGRTWNDIILNLRKTDHLSDAEKDIFLFSTFDWLSKPIYLPLYQTAGCIEQAVFTFKEAALSYNHEADPLKKRIIIEECSAQLDLTAKEAVSECWELVGFILSKFMGPLHQNDTTRIMTVIATWAQGEDLFTKFNSSTATALVESTANIITALKAAMPKRRASPVVTSEMLQSTDNGSASSAAPPDSGLSKSSGGGLKSMKKSVSTGFLSDLQGAQEEDRKANGSDNNAQDTTISSTRKFAKLQPFRTAKTITDNLRDKIREDVKTLFSTLRNAFRMKSSISPEGQDVLDRCTFVLSMENGFLWNDVYASTQIDELAKDARCMPALCKCHGLLKLRQTQVDPVSSEAVRRMHFFINSLFMDMPSVPSTQYGKEYTCMTPFYSEDVLLTKDDLESKNSDGISVILYLQTLYKRDWQNFLERQKLSDDQLIYSAANLQETRIWASLRAQTLFRTVEGMMYTETALRLLCELEQLSASEINCLSKLKFNYVVACQVYGQMRKNLEHKADDIEFLLARHPNLRVAYIDQVRPTKEGDAAFYSVLIKGDALSKNGVKEVYRIKLPGNPVLGEGKPENQNHAIVFSRGRYLQAIDMNQDGYFEEALKMRNLLQEFDKTGCSILGFREHIFTGSVSSVANYMALQELSFVTLGQRVLNQPLRIRQHYGHPDIFDKVFVMTEGGMSKASRGINLSEDVFAGYNATIRGHSVNFVEYAQVGKGRDVGLQQTYKFEAKLAQGNAEQSLSRDLSRICDRLDFFRLMSFYYGGIGHYMANTMVMFALVVVVYTMLGLAIYGEEGVNGRPMHPEGVLQLLLSGMGILQTLPLYVTLTVEKGFLAASSEIAFMMLSGGPLYFIFHIQTKCYYFQQTLLAGGAMYRPTGRGFVTRHSPFDENYRFFASSHIYLGFDLMVALILFAMYTSSEQYPGLTWSLWMTVVSFMLGPFWFNPVTFELNKVKEDYILWLRWMQESGGSAEQSWEVWWREENSFFGNLSFSWKCLLVFQKSCLWVGLGLGLLGGRFLRDPGEHQRIIELLCLVAGYLVCSWILSKLERSVTYAVRRLAALTLSTAMFITIVYLFTTHTLYIKYAVAIYYLLSAVAFIFLACGQMSIRHIYKIHDYLVGHTLFFLLGLLSFMQVCWFLALHVQHPITQYSLFIHTSIPIDWVPPNLASVSQRTVSRCGNRRRLEIRPLDKRKITRS